MQVETATHMQSTDGNQLWCPGQSLLSLMAEHVPGSELRIICRALGCSLIDMYTEVHAEAVRWYEMWQEGQRGGNYSSRAGTPLPLADPPVVKELVRAEVRMLLQNLKERAISEGRDDEFLFRYKPETVNYALGHLDSCPDPGGSDNESRPSSHCSVQSTAEDEIYAVKDKLNVTDIEKVVDRLKSVLTEECKALEKQIQHLKGNMKQKNTFDKTEPSLADLRELRGAIQTDLKLYPTFTPSKSSPLPVKALNNSFRLSAEQRASDKTLPALTATSVLRPHPPPAPRHMKPIPPGGPPLVKNSINAASLSATHGQHRSTSAAAGSNKTPTTIHNRFISSGHRNYTVPGTDKIMDKHLHPCTPEQDSAGLHRRTPTSSSCFQKKPQINSPVHKEEVHLSSHSPLHSPSRKCDLSQQTGRNRSLAPRSRNINIIPSPVPALSSLCDADRYSSNATDHSVSTPAKSQNGPQNRTCGGSLMSIKVQREKVRKSTTESFHCVTKTHSARCDTGNCTVKTDNGIYRNENGHLGEDVHQQQSLNSHCLTERSSHQTESRGTQREDTCTQPKPIQINGQLITCPKRPLDGTTSQPKSVQEAQTEQEFLNRIFQPVPSARIPTVDGYGASSRHF